ncbi:hypothetical protein QFC21_004391 [Naganishia friedmannii]|uniref:Uncharacterized protein n=1 Tax=Naganishia friedmannii TaxID=89922 RepID=A0ACC2VHY5_9TREE|nr:hypothetical protein QFC21_004391 [Naganishia friedmannii]
MPVRSGAPAWTLHAAGLSSCPTTLIHTGAAYVGGVTHRGVLAEGERGLWPTGYTKLACATMNTLFYAGKTFAPSLMVNTRTGLPSHISAPRTAPHDDGEADDEEQNIQEFLQDRYMGMFERLVRALEGVEGVLGFEVCPNMPEAWEDGVVSDIGWDGAQLINEPHPGYIGMQTLHKFEYNTDLHLGPAPSPVQGFALGAGHPTEVAVYTRSWPVPTRWTRNVVLNRERECAWLPGPMGEEGAAQRGERGGPVKGGECAWAREGVWAWDTEQGKPVVLKEGYFSRFASSRPRQSAGEGNRRGVERDQVDFYKDFYWPFVRRWEDLVRREAGEGKMLHVEAVPNQFCPEWLDEVRPRNLVFSPHWYDLNVLFNKTFGFMSVNVQGLAKGMFIARALYFGHEAAKDNYALQIGNLVRAAYDKLGEIPVVIGETGIPMDMNNREAFKTGDFRWQQRMMDALMTALERNMVGFNLWNYNPENCDELGDDWNFENFSWFSHRALDERIRTSARGVELDQGCRLIREVVRPYAIRTAGIPLKLDYQARTGSFLYQFANPSQGQPITSTGNVPSVPLHGHPSITSRVTEIYLPPWLADASLKGQLLIKCSDGSVKVDEEQQRVFWAHEVTEQGFVHEIRIRYMGRTVGEDARSWWWMVLLAVVCVLVAMILA